MHSDANSCDACRCPLENGEAICPSCGHWQEVETWYRGLEPRVGAEPVCWVLLRLEAPSRAWSAGRWSVGRSAQPSFARAAALVAGHLRRPQALGLPASALSAQGYPVDADRVCLEGSRQTACWELLGGLQALTLSEGSAGIGFSETGSRVAATARALAHAHQMADLCCGRAVSR